ncbi:hypothetical protein SYJ56_14270 [Algoriphagus sp. D3-2-R+10]|uniref:hypothetical protein n=1 Tax=Algoriphagus aurantiacus TaxID=3103948 RepID=UPI002B395CFD|nr:hypothetical protein [Algoriphagus sp. D3-2-R+10]MEB2776484.1 hypothetical protein [Algoriphagus sp. D3-2-R+10]
MSVDNEDKLRGRQTKELNKLLTSITGKLAHFENQKTSAKRLDRLNEIKLHLKKSMMHLESGSFEEMSEHIKILQEYGLKFSRNILDFI